MDLPSLRHETRYGMPAADQIMFNRHYVLGYSYYFRQAKWALEIIDPDLGDFERLDNFRSDFRIPEMFRIDPEHYKGSGYDRGHLIASADQRETKLQNSETFLLSNMSPQKPKFNRDIWRKLESKVRELDSKKKYYETYVICGPLFFYNQEVECLGTIESKGVEIPIPHAYFKSVLAETNKGRLHMWSFVMKNEESDAPLESFQVPTTKVEKIAGIMMWERLEGRKIELEKKRIRKLW